jgi:hypothetical protein
MPTLLAVFFGYGLISIAIGSISAMAAYPDSPEAGLSQVISGMVGLLVGTLLLIGWCLG